jgi:hypothetical protein
MREYRACIHTIDADDQMIIIIIRVVKRFIGCPARQGSHFVVLF